MTVRVSRSLRFSHLCVTCFAFFAFLVLFVSFTFPASQPQQARSPDFNGDGEVGFDDLFAFSSAFGQQGTGGNAKFDLNSNGRVDAPDFLLFAQSFGKQASAISLTPPASPGPNAGAKLAAALDKISGVKAGDKVILTVSVTGASGLTGYIAEALYDSNGLADPVTAAKLAGATSPGKTSRLSQP